MILHLATTLVSSQCNLTKYEVWKAQKYVGYLSTDPNFWRYQTQTQFVLTKGLAIELVVSKCQNNLEILTTYLAGRSGPITIQNSYKALCSHECIETDRISVEAIDYSGCTCLELSTQPGNPYYTVPGDWCLHNSARLLCASVGYCGRWNCDLSDYACPRYEFNKKYIPLKGWGSCVRNGALSSVVHKNINVVSILTILTMMVLFVFF